MANSSIIGVPYSELIKDTGFEIQDNLNLGKNDPFGAKELREALAKIYKCSPTNVIPTTGGSEANFLVFLGLLEPGDEVIVEQPGYSPLWLVPQALGARVSWWERRYEDKFALDEETLKNKITNQTKLIVITNLHNPSGAMVELETIRAIAELAKEKGAWLFIDEMFLEVANTDSPPKSAFGIESVIVTASVSKIYGIGGLRTGWIIAPEDIAEQCLLAKWQASVAAPYFSELLTAAALDKARDKLIQRCKSIAAQNFPIVNDWLAENENYIEWVPPTGGILCYPKYKCSNKIDSVTLCRQLFIEKGVLVSPGEYFGTEGHFRMSFMNPQDELREGLAAIIDTLIKVG
ncbi:aminotransferase class I/II-fold pyridoxal phosphate-dependent enzyme [[Eubacterium] cellulosolvens]